MPPKQDRFEFADEPVMPIPTTEPSRPVRAKPHGSSICAWCGARMPSALLDTTPPVDDNRWTAAAPYHAPTCRWIATKGLRIDEGSTL
jgi:hypothetical protein